MKHSSTAQGHEKKTTQQGKENLALFRLGKGHERKACIHTDNEKGLQCLQVSTVVSGTRRCGALCLNIVDTSPDYSSQCARVVFPAACEVKNTNTNEITRALVLKSVTKPICLSCKLHLGDVDSSEFLYSIWQLGHDVQHFSSKFGGSYICATAGHHGNLLCRWQWLADFLCHLQNKKDQNWYTEGAWYACTFKVCHPWAKKHASQLILLKTEQRITISKKSQRFKATMYQALGYKGI